jgi:hypothetical protein
MAGSNPTDFFELVKTNILNIALCLFLLVGATKLLIEELKPLVVAFKQLRELFRK